MAEYNPLKLGMSEGSYQTDFWSPEQWQEFGKSGGTVGADGTLNYGTDGLSLGSIGSVGSALSSYVAPAGLAMNAYSTFFGQGKEAFDKNMTLLNQQIESNKDKLGRRKALNRAWAGTESNKNAGLAASGIA